MAHEVTYNSGDHLLLTFSDLPGNGLTGATQLNMVMRQRGGAVTTIDLVSSITGAATVDYAWNWASIPGPGLYRVKFRAVQDDGRIVHVPNRHIGTRDFYEIDVLAEDPP